MGTSNTADKVVVITGASSGIGESTALLARYGATVVLGARRNDWINVIAKEISAAGGKALSVATDVTKRADVEALSKRGGR